MKTFGLVLFVMTLGAGWAVASGSGLSITSPDHPAIWYNASGTKVSQDLMWDAHKQQLVLRLAYDQVEFTPQNDQTYYDTFRLWFPTVQLDSSTNRLYFRTDDGRRVDIGHIEPGIMGIKAVLNDRFQLSAHRQDGRIEAKIIAVDVANR